MVFVICVWLIVGNLCFGYVGEFVGECGVEVKGGVVFVVLEDWVVYLGDCVVRKCGVIVVVGDGLVGVEIEYGIVLGEGEIVLVLLVDDYEFGVIVD